MPENEDSPAVHLEYDGDLYWLNINRRGELWINTKEKPRPVFRAVKGTRVETPEEPKVAEKSSTDQPPAKAHFEPRPRRDEKPPGDAASSAPGEPLPAGPALLEKIRPLMRRNRRGPGGSGSASFLSRALKCNEADLIAAFAALGLVMPADPKDKPVFVEIGTDLWWLNQDSRGGVWINGREKKDGETVASAREAEQPAAPASDAPAPANEPAANAPVPAVAPASPLAALRLILKETKTGAVAGKVERLAETLGQSPEQLLTTLVGAGLAVPDKPKDKPIFVEHAGEIFWLNKNAKDELWLNAKASKYPDKGEGDDAKPRRGRSRKKETE